MRNIVIIILIIILGISLLKLSIDSFSTKKSDSVKIGNTSIIVDVAKTPEETSLGLSYRKELPLNQGMLFIFPSKSYQTFWMKGMNFDLDFIWIVDNKVIDITENVPAPRENVPDEALSIYRSKIPVEAMLEVNSGFVKKNGIRIGDNVKIN